MTIDLSDIIDNADSAVSLDWYKDNNGEYTQIGSLIHDLKYFYIHNIQNPSFIGRIDDLAIAFKKYIDQFERDNPNFHITVIAPIPSYNPQTKSNPSGSPKIMYLVTERLATMLQRPFTLDLAEKVTDKQAKTNSLLSEDIQARVFPEQWRNATILVIDDLFGTGSSASLTLKAIKEKNPRVKLVFVTATKNKFGGLGHTVEGKLSSKIPKLSINNNQYLSIDFTHNNSAEHVSVFEGTDVFDALKEIDTGATINFQVKKGSNGYWHISQINNIK